jgi:hypothetical protein
MISFTPQSARGIAARSAHTAPATIPAAIIVGRSAPAPHVENVNAAHDAPIAPAWNCPSAPMFHRRIRKGIATARPQRASGTAFRSDCVSANSEPNAPRRSASTAA